MGVGEVLDYLLLETNADDLYGSSAAKGLLVELKGG